MKKIYIASIAALCQLYLFYMIIDKLVQVYKEDLTKRIILLFFACTWFLSFLMFAYDTYKEIKLRKNII
jgi:hypothetical protein